ncbi:MAG: hypothetical protein ISS16_11445 [Ignavibacteria bacterium]|nr:hypothetical protein [Ignavibacteria bacterium]
MANTQQNNNKDLVGCFIFYLILGGIIVGILVNSHFNKKKKFTLANYAEKKIELSKKWQDELWQEYGQSDILKGIANDPDLTILQMLEEIGNKAAPPQSKVAVSIENFTEFDIYITVYEQIEKETASETVKSILVHCSYYVNSIKFVYQDNVVKIIEKREIDKVKDWKVISLSSVEKLFKTP